jgi:predicted DCC family thiol-disulfide oxidoreductase YuxK
VIFNLFGFGFRRRVKPSRVFVCFAALRIARNLSGAWRWFYGFIVVPSFFRDIFYKLFAKYRYRMFGKQDACMMPTPEIRERFLAMN